jgi:hypothetical protein
MSEPLRTEAAYQRTSNPSSRNPAGATWDLIRKRTIAMRNRGRSAAALGAAFALVLTLSAAVTPAAADTPFIDIGPLPTPKPVIHTNLDLIPDPQMPTFKPDIRVKYLDKASVGGKMRYRFRVQNIGAASAENIGLSTVVGQDANVGSVSTRQEGNGGTIAYLGQDQSQEVTVVCTPLAGYHCSGARLDAHVADDLDTSNNSDGVNH